MSSKSATSESTDAEEMMPVASFPSHRARGIIDISQITLDDVPLAIEERLRKSKGVLTAQINAFSKKLAVEFDPSMITLEKVMKMITRQPRK